MTDSSTAEATGGEALSVDEAANAFMAMMGPEEGNPEAETQGDDARSEAEDEPEDAEKADDGAEAEEESDEDDEQTEEEAEQPQTFRVKVDGEEVEVTLEELQRGYSRQADYTRKTQELAEKAKALDTEREGFSQQRTQAVAILEAWEQQLSQPLYDPAETEALRFTDPGEYAARMTQEQQRQSQLRAITGKKAEFTEAEKAEQAQSQQRRLAEEEAKLLDAIPEWKASPDIAKKGLEEIWAYAAKHGFSPQDILSDPDHRTLLILRDAAAYQAIKAQRPKVEKKVQQVKTAAPGAKVSSSKVSEVTRARQRLAKTHNVHDAAKVFELLLPD